MSRKPRHIVAGCVYHLISRFVDRQWFITSALEREHYLSLLARALTESDWRCLGYAVMSNHIHMETVAGRDTLSSWIRRVHSPFADAMNRAHDRIGPVFVRGPKAHLVPPEKVGRVLAYIHNNPVRAGVVAQPGDSDWTSHRAYTRTVRAPRWLHVDEGLERCGASALQFDDWVRTNHVTFPVRTEDETFAELELEEAVEPDEAPHVDARELVGIVADAVGLSIDEMRSRRKQAPHVLARHVAAHCGDRLGLRGTDIARALGTSQQSVSKILTQTGLRTSEECLVRLVLDRVSGLR